MKRFIWTALTVFKILFVILSFGLFISMLLGYRLYTIESGSMEPFLYRNDAVIVSKNRDYQDIKTGDVIIYTRYDGLAVIHRVIDVTDEGLVLQGDANMLPDQDYVTESMYVGAMIIKLPKIGVVFRLVKRPLFACILVAIVAGVYFGADFLNEKQNKSSDEIQNEN